MTDHLPLSPKDLAAFIRVNLPLTAVPLVPEIRLHRARPTSGLGRLAAGASPYWAYPWPGGIALARYVLDRPATVAGRTVLDLGAGSGLVAIAAAKAGAAAVMVAEIDPHARAALALNAEANRATLNPLTHDLLGGPSPEADLILVGDLFYARPLARRVTAFLDRCIGAGREVLVGDIGRTFLPRSRLHELAVYHVADVGEAEDASSQTAAVYRFGPG